MKRNFYQSVRLLPYLCVMGVTGFLAASNASAQSYCASGATSTADSEVDRVVFGTINNNTTGICATYSNFTAQSTTVTIGQVVPITVQAGTCGGNFTKYGAVFIDWNRDFDFVDPGETAWTFGPSPATQSFNGNITVPGTALPGSTRMRVIVMETGSAASILPCGTYAYGETEDYTVNINPSGPNDIGVTAFLAPNSGCNLGNEQVRVSITNFGTNTQTTFNVSYRINGGAIVTETVSSASLASLASMNYTFTALANLSVPGTYNFKAWTTLAGDASATNDTIASQVISVPGVGSYPFCENFETNNGGWTAGGTSGTWAWGTPNKTTINSAGPGGTKCWVNGGLTGDYLNNDQSWVMGPCFNFSTLQNPWFSADIWWDTESGWDGAVLQASTNFGTSWVTIGNFGDPFNWYNDQGLNAQPGGHPDGWAGSFTQGSGGWVHCAHRLDGLAGAPSVRLRIAFGSDGSVVYDGFAFDNICIGDGPVPNLGPDILLCAGDTAVLDPGTFVDYDYTTGTTTRLDTVTTANAGTIVVRVTDAQGFYGIDTIRVSVSVPYVNVGPDSSICPGDTVAFNVSWPNATYSWQDGSTDSTFFGTTQGWVHATLTDSVGCVVEDSMYLTILVPPTLSLGNDTSVCSGNAVVLDGGPGPFGTIYDWSTGANTQVVVVNAAGTYYADVTTPGGCTSTDTVVVTYLPAPGVNLGPDRVECNTFVLDAGPNGTAYSWSAGGSSQTYTGTVGGTYSVTVTNSFGCSESDDVVITMGNVPVVNLGPDQIICNNSSVTLNAGNPGSTYLWSNAQTSQSITVSQAGLYIVYVTDPSGCTSADSISITSSPLIVNLGPDVALCNNNNVTLDAGNPGMTYAWSNGPTTQTNTISAPGTYTVTVTDALNCSATDLVVVTQAPAIAADFVLPPAGTLFQPSVFTDASTPTPMSWAWDFGDGGTSTQQSPSHTYLAFGTYQVRLIVTNGVCRDTIIKPFTVVNFIGVDAGDFASALQVFPNPSQGLVQYTVDFDHAADLKVVVYDLTGKTVYQDISTQAFHHAAEMDLTTLPRGVYILRMESEGKAYFHKLILQ